jgi:hypothetical protein
MNNGFYGFLHQLLQQLLFRNLVFLGTNVLPMDTSLFALVCLPTAGAKNCLTLLILFLKWLLGAGRSGHHLCMNH